MKKVLVALAMVMGLGSSVAFAYVVSETQSVEQTQQNPQDEFTKVEVKDLPQAVMNVLAKDYEGAVIKEAFISEKETGKIYKVVLTITKENQSTEKVTVLLNEKGEILFGMLSIMFGILISLFSVMAAIGFFIWLLTI